MSPSIVIIGFPSTYKVPGAYGIVKYGAGATSAASIPLLMLVVALWGLARMARRSPERGAEP